MGLWGRPNAPPNAFTVPPPQEGGTRALLSGAGGGGQGRFLMRSLVDGAGSYSVAHRAGLLPTELTGMWGWILLRSPGQGVTPRPRPHYAKAWEGLSPFPVCWPGLERSDRLAACDWLAGRRTHGRTHGPDEQTDTQTD